MFQYEQTLTVDKDFANFREGDKVVVKSTTTDLSVINYFVNDISISEADLFFMFEDSKVQDIKWASSYDLNYQIENKNVSKFNFF